MADLPPRWRDHLDGPADVPPVPDVDGPAPYGPIGAFQADTYGRNAFAQGTAAEAEVLAALIGAGPGLRVLDVGCADGRHLRTLRERGVWGVGVDLAFGALRAGRGGGGASGAVGGPGPPGGVAFVQADARRLPLRPGSFDAVLCLCQGGLGATPAADPAIVAALARAVRPGGTVVFSVFHALAAARNLVAGDRFDPVHLVHHHDAEVVGPDREVRRFPLWTAAYTVPGAVRLARDAGLVVEEVRGVEPGRFEASSVALDDPEVLVRATRPA